MIHSRHDCPTLYVQPQLAGPFSRVHPLSESDFQD
jgi:hypothetical protein